MPSDKSLQTYFFLWYHIIFCTLQNMAGTWVISTIGLKNKYIMLIWGVLWTTPLTSYHTIAYIASVEILAHCIRTLCSSVFYHRHLTELLCLMGEEDKKNKKIKRKPLKAVILFAIAQICRGIWEHTLTTLELNVLVTLSWGCCGQILVHIANQGIKNKILDFVLTLLKKE